MFFKKRRIEILKPKIQDKTIEYFYEYDGKKHSFVNKFNTNQKLHSGVEGVISIFLPHAILTGREIYTKVPVDETYLQNVGKFVEVFRKWHKSNFYFWRRRFNLNLKLNAPSKKIKPTATKKKKVLTFTLGVDSFYTLYSNIKNIDAILFIVGFDIGFHQEKLLNETLKNLKKVAKLHDKELIICETDLRSKVNHGQGFAWGTYFHGPAIFNVFHCFKESCEAIIASSNVSLEAKDFIWGAHPLIDKYHSSSKLTIKHDRYLSRVEKIKFILDFDIRCLNFLRVCWRNFDQKYNCSKCEKCLRTLHTIELFGHKDKAITFDRSMNGAKYWECEPPLRPKSLFTYRQEMEVLSEEYRKKNE